MASRALHLLDLRRSSVSIFDQLVIEEALLRADSRNWCILNTGHSKPAIVMGISGRPLELVDIAAAKSAAVPVIRRFTGGGTVVVDEGTLFVSFVCNRADVTGAPLYPREVMTWSEGLYAPLLARLAPGSPFVLHEHDYCLGDFKVGGNAQSVSRDRWVHHTSWLWDYTPAHMALLALPSKRPAYRRDRPHTSFLTRLSDHVEPSLSDVFMTGIAEHAAGVWAAAGHGAGVTAGLEDVQAALVKNERRSNSVVDLFLEGAEAAVTPVEMQMR